MGKIISVINNKGGSGKTATVEILSELLSSLGYKILAIDLDHQCNLSMALRRFQLINDKSIKNIFKHKCQKREDVEQYIQQTDIDNIDIIASDEEHNNTERDLALDLFSNTAVILKKALDTIKDKYDFILIDNAPANNILTVNSMIASDYVLCPAKCEEFSHKGIVTTLQNIKNVQESYMLNDLKFLGTFLVATEPNTNRHKKTIKLFESEFKDKFFKTYIRKDIKVVDMESDFIPLLEIDPSSNALHDYANLLLEFNIMDEEHSKILREAIQA